MDVLEILLKELVQEVNPTAVVQAAQPPVRLPIRSKQQIVGSRATGPVES
jgi:hypothetical protein